MQRLFPGLALLVAGCVFNPGAAIHGQASAPTAPMQFLQLLGSARSDGFVEHVNHGTFWAANASLGQLALWQAWVRNDPASPNGYVVSDGYGGAHAMLFNGFATGNYWNGSGAVSFGCDDGVLSRWAEISVALQHDQEGMPIVVSRVDGIPCGMVPQDGIRTEPPGGWGAGVLYIGGSSHIPWSGLIAQLRVYDRSTYLPYGLVAWVPERLYSTNNDTGFNGVPDLLVDYTRPGTIIADLSDGYGGGDDTGPRVHHPGRPESDTYGLVYGQPTEPPSGPPPQWVTTSDHPFGAVLPSQPGGRGLVPPACPAGVRVCDSFSRDDQTYAYFDVPSLGSTEGGTLGPLAWRQGCTNTGNFPSAFGVLNGAAVFFEQAPCVAWVSDPRLGGDQDVSIDGRAGVWGNGNTSVAFRVQDRQNWWVAQELWNPTQGGAVGLGYFLGGGFFSVAAVTGISRGQHTIRATVVGDTITVYLDGTALLNTVSTVLHGAPGVGFGIAENGASDEGLARWRNLLVR